MDPNSTELQRIWDEIAEQTSPSQRVWLRNSRPVVHAENTFIVAVPNEFTQNQFVSRLRTFVEDALTVSYGTQTRLLVSVDESLDTDLFSEGPANDDSSRDDHAASAVSPDPAGTAAPAPGPPPVESPESLNRSADLSTNSQVDGQRGPGLLNAKYTFDTFVIGASNRFAHAAAVAVAEAPGRSYNPLMIYGDSGLGKTHLLHAITDYVHRFSAGKTVRYVSSEEFTNEFINAIQQSNVAAFQKKYREVDVLLIDDIQFLEGKIQTQEEFFHTFNSLHNANKQIVLTSDRAPKAIEKLEDRLRNRFEWGLLTDVQAPDLETRIAILLKKAAAERLEPPRDVLEFIASRIHTNIRELEGALIRVSAFANINRQPIDLTLAEIVLRDLIPDGESHEITAGLIIAQSASFFEISIDDLCGPSRTRPLVAARHVAMYLCRELTSMSLPQIAKEFGGRDHSTVISANKKIARDMAERRTLYHQVTQLTTLIKQRAQQG
ncbi:chromosomal replication initiator protein DnaA [Marmoricola endophyticus]|uniref:chromosomal replication initiator protein DnaA n=1 Tax=Marmoricola endophyticus TaxID=2040280 RepID=UPI001E62335A|nr:chromosomal replication initiator protein DnaA [Marmoricola endophyticus]